MRRVAAIFLATSLGWLVSACQIGGASIPAPVAIQLSQKIDKSSWPLQWQAQQQLDAVFPQIPPAFDERFAEGERFLNDSVKLTPEMIARATSANLHGFARSGMHSAVFFEITPEGADYRIVIQEVRENHAERTNMLVNANLKLKDYTAERKRRTGATIETSFVRGKWDTNKDGRTIYRINTGGRDRELRSDQMLVPEDLLLLLPLFAPEKAYTANFKLVSLPFAGIYRCDFRVRPAADPAAAPRRIVEIHPRSPLGEEHVMILGADGRIESGKTHSGIAFEPLSTTDPNRFQAFFALRRRERDALVFNGTQLYSKFDANGNAVASDNETAYLSSWLSLDASGLDLMVAPSVPTDVDAIAELLNRSTLDLYNDAIRNKDLNAIANARSFLRPDARHLQVKLDYHPRRDKRLDFADIIAANAVEEGEVEGYRSEELRVSGHRAVRIEYVVRKYGRIDNRSVKSPPLFRSILLVDAGTVVVNITISMGADWQKYTGGVRAVQASLRVEAPQINGPKH